MPFVGAQVEAKPLWQPQLKRLSDIPAQKTEFLWYPYIPRGAITLLFGYGGMGKSWITAALAADLSAGRPLPGHKEASPPQKTIIISAEDDPARVMHPRMQALKADMDNILVSDEPFTLTEAHLHGLYLTMKEVQAAVVFLDPMASFLGGKMDPNKLNETRAMMGPLAKAAADTGCAVVCVHHSRKDNGGRSANRALGSVDFINSTRSALMVDETENGRRFMSHIKHNWSSKGPAITYTIDDDVFAWGEIALDLEKVSVSRVPLMQKKARELIVGLLGEGPRSAVEIMQAATLSGIPTRTLDRAKKGLAHSIRKDNAWFWELDPGVDVAQVVSPSVEEAPLSASDPLEALGRGPVGTPVGVTPGNSAMIEKLLSEARQVQGKLHG